MSSIILSDEEQSQLCKLARSTHDAKTAIRIRIILALAKGYSVLEVADILLIDEDTVTEWKRKFQNRRLFSDWLSSANTGTNSKLSDNQLRELDLYVSDNTIVEAAAVVDFIKAQFNQYYTVNGVIKLLHRLGFVYKQTTLIPGKLDEAAQAQFKAEYEKLRDNLAEDEVILFGDGVHPSHNVHATKAWVKKGQDKQVPTNTGRKRLNINGVLDLAAMKVVEHFCDRINAQTTIELLDKIQASYPDKSRIYIIIDNARYYKNKAVEAYLAREDVRIKLKFLPPYSPNLNFIERLWHFMKKHVIGIKRRDKFKDFEADIHHFFDHIGDYEAKLRQFIGTEMHLIKLNN